MRKSGEKAERLFQRFNDSRRIACNHDIVTKTLSNNSTGRDNDVVTECHTWVDGCMPANPAVVADRDRLGELFAAGTFNGIERVTGGVQPHLWANQAVITNDHFCTIEDDTVVVGVEVVADFDVYAVVTVKMTIDRNVAACSAKLENSLLRSFNCHRSRCWDAFVPRLFGAFIALKIFLSMSSIRSQ